MSLRVAIAGAGFIGAVHAHAVRAAGGTVVGVAASTPERGHAAAARLGVERAYDGAADLAADDAVDLVCVCTPNHLHEDVARRALEAGRHVVCEKPLATDRAGAERLAALAARRPACAAVPFAYRYYPTVREARHRVTTGASGAVRLVHGTYLQDWLLSPEDDNWRVDAALGGASRAFADIGSHWCDLAEFVTGHRIARVCARTLTAIPERRHRAAREAFARPSDGGGALRAVTTEDAAVLQFETDRGALGSAVVSQLSAGRKNRLWLEVDAAREALAFDQEEPESLWVGGREQSTIVRRDPTTLSPEAARLAILPAGHPQGYQDCFDLFFADVFAAVAGEAPDGLPRFDAGLRAARITDAVLTSAREERWVDVVATA